ncbi:hypothetical protein VTL71DRAFT_14248 [Oculimacula yallundae]|uniref:Acid phosphatase n=1 Tax=Oculimacula yallundae TaxID=86028 RepID=A0ABR4CII0_9HELO
MYFSSIIAVALAFATATQAQYQYTATDKAAVAAAQATAKTLSPVSSIKGKKFDRFVQIWLENTDFDMAAADPSLAWIAKQGITLTNYRALTHPSQPNYIASVGGSLHWVLLDFDIHINPKEKTIVDLLEPAGVSYSVYGEDMPYSGFQGDYVNQQNGANAYVRKHNPLISYDSFASVEDRLAKSKNFTMFQKEVATGMLPQWIFLTPNMTNDGHDSSVTVAGKWAKSFLEPLLTNKNFMQNTLILLTFDETENYLSKNKVFSVLLGDAVPANLHGTKNDTAYTHYSIMKTVENNWNLGNLGQRDANATPFF